ncbi:MAG: glutaminyl-peptide cyclotransferase [Chlamydiales bacterium]|jgi:glutaminyl-peptide cyclotransferase
MIEPRPAYTTQTHLRHRLRRATWILALGAGLSLGCETGSGMGNDDEATAPGATIAFDTKRAWSDLEAMVALGPRPAGSTALGQLIDTLEAELRAAKLTPVRQDFEVETPVGKRSMTNMIADIPGRERDGAPAPIVILCTHIDTKIFDYPFVGANDGGSGTAVLLELARGLAASAPHAVTYRLIFLDGEEATRTVWRGEDNTYGSRHYAQTLMRGPDLARVKACVLLDMVGDSDLKLTQDTNSDRALLGFFFQAARDNGLGQHVGAFAQPIKDDHLQFMRVGIPSCDLIDLEFGPGNRFWHTPADTLANCSPASLEAIGRIVLLGLPKLEAWALNRP